MPLTPKGEKIMGNMQSEYGDKKGEQVFYASRNAGKISGVDPESSGKKKVGVKPAERKVGVKKDS